MASQNFTLKQLTDGANAAMRSDRVDFEVHRKAPLGPADDPGWLVGSVVGQHYVDLEFRTSPNETDLEQTRLESFFMWMPIHAELHKFDFVELHNSFYRVTDIYSDSGFMMARIDREADYRIDGVIIRDGQRVYDKEAVRWTTVKQAFNVTMTLDGHHDHGSWVTDAQTTCCSR